MRVLEQRAVVRRDAVVPEAARLVRADVARLLVQGRRRRVPDVVRLVPERPVPERLALVPRRV